MKPTQAGDNLASFVSGYNVEDEIRTQLPNAIVQRATAMHHLLANSHRRGIEPWASMFTTGHGAHWAKIQEYVRENQQVWADALGTPRP